MKTAREVASYFIVRYETLTKSSFGTSELKLQKLMYLLQRQSFAIKGAPFFKDVFEGWVHGPVLPALRFFLEEPQVHRGNGEDFSLEEKYIIDNVIHEYGRYSSWELREITHEESSWRNSRKGLRENDYGTAPIRLEDIQKDAENVRVYDYHYDMYLDEFEPFDQEVLSSCQTKH